eukprot:2111593-Ditylum_brightwellii.AAC.1
MERADATNLFRKEHLQIDFAANPRCPYMDLGQSFYSRILGVSVFMVVSSLRNETYVYFFDEQNAKKGSDEVVSTIKHHLTHFVDINIGELIVHCDGCAGQSWNNRLALFFEEIVDPQSDICREMEIGFKRIDLYRGVSGHTYMQCDTEGGRIQREARKILLTRTSRNGGFVHVMRRDEEIDPEYT